MKLQINLATRNDRKERLTALALFSLLIALVAVGSFQVLVFLEARAEQRDLMQISRSVSDSLSAVEADLKGRGLDISPDGLDRWAQRVGVINELLSRRAFSWTRLLNDLEAAVPRNISIIRLQPRFSEGRMALNGRALSLKDLTRLMIRIEDSSAFQDVFLRDQKTDREGFIEFTVEFTYHRDRRPA